MKRAFTDEQSVDAFLIDVQFENFIPSIIHNVE